MGTLKRWLSGLQRSLLGEGSALKTPKEGKPRLAKPVRQKAAQAHVITLDDQPVHYALERSNRKTIGMIIGAHGLLVRAHPRVPLHEIERVLHGKSAWLLKHINKSQSLPQHHASFVPSLDLNDGDTLHVLGRAVQVRWVSGAPKFEAADFWLGHQTELVLRNVSTERRVNALQKALTDILMLYLYERAQYFDEAHGLRCHRIMLSNAKTLWGTCRSNGVIRINARLVFLPEQLANYVLAHELSHTRHMNHSKDFWAQVQAVCPDYKHWSKTLKQYNLRAC
jgi:predicted metal-dependent hydrolase